MNKYLVIVERLYEDIDKGIITIELAEQVNDLAYEKYVNEAFFFKKKKEKKKEIKAPQNMEELAKRLSERNKEIDDSLNKINRRAGQVADITSTYKDKINSNIQKGREYDAKNSSLMNNRYSKSPEELKEIEKKSKLLRKEYKKSLSY